MRLVIVGATPVGLALARQAAEGRHEVWLVERERDRAERAVKDLDARVIHADIADADVSGEAEFEGASAVVAVTGDDSDNLMAMVLAGEADVATRVSVVNERTHRRMFERLGVQVLEDPEAILARHLYDLVLHPRARRIHPVSDDDEWVIEVEVGSGSRLAGNSIDTIRDEDLIPEGMKLLRVYPTGTDGGEALDPDDDVRVEAGHRLLLLSSRPVKDRELDVFTGD